MWSGQSFVLLAYTKQTLVAHKTALHWYERLNGSPVTKLMG
jgi:hypothetical protein